jgi:hypothetical protein
MSASYSEVFRNEAFIFGSLKYFPESLEMIVTKEIKNYALTYRTL